MAVLVLGCGLVAGPLIKLLSEQHVSVTVASRSLEKAEAQVRRSVTEFLAQRTLVDDHLIVHLAARGPGIATETVQGSPGRPLRPLRHCCR